jgi:enoyl-CoA hydratase
VACPVPVIAAVNGVAITGGFELVLACDVILASTEARFADTHARLGILPAWGMTQRLPRLIGMNRAKQLSFSGVFLDADRAERWGLVNQVCPPDELLPTAIALAGEMAAADRRAVRNLKAAYDEGASVTMGEGLRLEREAARRHMTEVRPEDIAARRGAVQERNRQLSGG